MASTVSDTSSHKSRLTPDQRRSFFISWLGWSMDSFDFFLLIKSRSDIESSFNIDNYHGTFLITATLLMRPVGAFIFGSLADKIGRKIPLLLVVSCYSLTSFLSAFAPNYIIFFILRVIFGIAMGGEWGLGTALTMEKVPQHRKGMYSGLLQGGYSFGYLCATLVYFILHTELGFSWRYIFAFSIIPAIFSLFIFIKIDESQEWLTAREKMIQANTSVKKIFFTKKIFLRFVFLILLMFAFTSLSHGTQDLYPQFLTTHLYHGANLTDYEGDIIAIIYTIAAIVGAGVCGTLSDTFGQKTTIITASLLSLLVIPIFSFSTNAGILCLGSALMQFLTQGAWANVPALLSDLSPIEIRGFYPGVTYQLSLVLSGFNLIIQQKIAENYGYPISFALVITISVVLVVFFASFLKPAPVYHADTTT